MQDKCIQTCTCGILNLPLSALANTENFFSLFPEQMHEFEEVVGPVQHHEETVVTTEGILWRKTHDLRWTS